MSSAIAMPTVWVMHAGALGDWVLLWPLLRAIGRSPARVVAVAHEQKARLAANCIECSPGSIFALPGGIDQPRLTRWWAGPAAAGNAASADWRAQAPDRIITFLCDGSTPAGRAWITAAAAEFPQATIEPVGAPGSSSRNVLWQRERIPEHGAVSPRLNTGGPIVCHIGAGSNDKRWPIERWRDLIQALRGDKRTVLVLAGEVERDRLTAAELALFEHINGRFIDSLAELASETAAARLFIGADTGPTHLAAQLGVPTMALFGPTDPAVWAPVGPAVRVLAPASPRRMDWLSVESVIAAAKSASAYTSPP